MKSPFVHFNAKKYLISLEDRNMLRVMRCLSSAPSEMSLLLKEVGLTAISMVISNELGDMTSISRSWLLTATHLCSLYKESVRYFYQG